MSLPQPRRVPVPVCRSQPGQARPVLLGQRAGRGKPRHPKVIELAPPGGARTRVVGRPVIKFPEFWLDPVAYALADIAGAAAGAASTSTGAAGGNTSTSTAEGAGGSSIMGIGAGPSSTESADSGVAGWVGVPSTRPGCCLGGGGAVYWSPKLIEEAPPGGA